MTKPLLHFNARHDFSTQHIFLSSVRSDDPVTTFYLALRYLLYTNSSITVWISSFNTLFLHSNDKANSIRNGGTADNLCYVRSWILCTHRTRRPSIYVVAAALYV